MICKLSLTIFFLVSFASTLFASTGDSSQPKYNYRIWIYTTNGNVVKGILVSSTDTTVQVFPGSFSDLKKGKKFSMDIQAYSNISDIQVKKRAAWLKGLAIGTLIGLSPAIFGEAGGYVGIVTLPVGIVTGTIIGAVSRKKFHIGSDLDNFKKFHHKVSKK